MVLLAPPPTAADINANATAPPALLPLVRTFCAATVLLFVTKKHAKVARNDKLSTTIQRLPLVGRTVRVRLKYR